MTTGERRAVAAAESRDAGAGKSGPGGTRAGKRAVVVILREDARVPPGHVAVAGGQGGARLRERAGLTALMRVARVRVLPSAESAVALPRLVLQFNWYVDDFLVWGCTGSQSSGVVMSVRVVVSLGWSWRCFFSVNGRSAVDGFSPGLGWDPLFHVM